MELTLYAMGSSELMFQMLNAIAAVFNDESFLITIRIGLIVFLFVAVLGTLISYGGTKQDVNVNYILGPWVVFPALILALFAVLPRVTVIVEDAYTGSAKVVDNVPAVLGIPFSFATSIGLYMTNFVETALTPLPEVKLGNSTTGQTGFLTAIYTFTNLEKYAPKGEYDKLTDSVHFYFKDCVSVEVTQINPPPRFTMTDVLSKPNVVEIIRDAGFVYVDTETYLNGGSTTNSFRSAPVQVSCSEAYDEIRTAVTQLEANPTHALHKEAGVLINPVQKTTSDNFEPSKSSVDLVDESWKVLGNNGSYSNIPGFDAGRMAVNQIFSAALTRAAKATAISEANGAYAIAIEQAERQQAEKFAASSQIYQEYAKPMIAFIEALIILMTLFIPLMFALGRFQFVLAWVMSMLWMSSWGPIFSLTNIYIYNLAASDIQGLADAINLSGRIPADYFMSMQGSQELAFKLSKHAQTGNLMASAVPIISAAVMGGSLMGLGKLASGSAGGGNLGGDFNQKIPANDLISPAANIQGAPSNTMFDGNVISNAQAVRGGASIGAQTNGNEAVTLSSAIANDKQSELGQQLSTVQGTTGNFKVAAQANKQLANTQAAQAAVGNDSNFQRLKEVLASSNLSSSEQKTALETFAAAVALSQGIGTDGKKTLKNTNKDGGIGDDQSNSQDVTAATAARLGLTQLSQTLKSLSGSSGASEISSVVDGLREQVGNIEKKGRVNTNATQTQQAQSFIASLDFGGSKTDQNTATSAFKEAVSARQALQQDKSFASGGGAQASGTTAGAVAQLARTGQLSGVNNGASAAIQSILAGSNEADRSKIEGKLDRSSASADATASFGGEGQQLFRNLEGLSAIAQDQTLSPQARQQANSELAKVAKVAFGGGDGAQATGKPQVSEEAIAKANAQTKDMEERAEKNPSRDTDFEAVARNAARGGAAPQSEKAVTTSGAENIAQRNQGGMPAGPKNAPTNSAPSLPDAPELTFKQQGTTTPPPDVASDMGVPKFGLVDGKVAQLTNFTGNAKRTNEADLPERGQSMKYTGVKGNTADGTPFESEVRVTVGNDGAVSIIENGETRDGKSFSRVTTFDENGKPQTSGVGPATQSIADARENGVAAPPREIRSQRTGQTITPGNLSGANSESPLVNEILNDGSMGQVVTDNAVADTIGSFYRDAKQMIFGNNEVDVNKLKDLTK